MATKQVVLIGRGRLADAGERALRAGEVKVVRLADPRDTDIQDVLDDAVSHVVVISRSDHVALRWALVVAYVCPVMPILVTIFDRHVASELEETARNVRVLSMAEVVAPALAAPCLDPASMSLVRRGDEVAAVRLVDEVPGRVAPPWRAPGGLRRGLANLESLLHPFDTSAQIMIYGIVGLFAVLLGETLMTALVEGVPMVPAFYLATKIVATVGPSPVTDRAGPALQLISAIGMLLVLGFTAAFTAGLVNRLLGPRLTSIVGRAAVPRRDHVVVVGLGQVGQRLCELLRDLDIPVVAVDQDPGATDLARAKERGLPVVIGDGADHRTLRRVSVRNARALAAVASDEVENIAVAVAARRLRADLQLALRAGDGDATSMTRSLFHIGMVRDVDRIAGAALAAVVLGHDVREAFPCEGTMYLVDHQGAISPLILNDA